MVRTLVKLTVLTCLFAGIATAQGRNFGLGVVIGAPTGISAKIWTSGTTAVDFALGWNRGNRDGGYWDSRCYDDGYYRNNPGYCRGQAYDWYDYGDRYGRRDRWRTLHIHADYLYHNFNAIRGRERFPLHYGPGINLEYWEYEEMLLGVRGNFGISWLPRRAPMDVFLDLAPIVYLFPEAFFDLNVGLGTRFYF